MAKKEKDKCSNLIKLISSNTLQKRVREIDMLGYSTFDPITIG